ncbi:PREDICTED: RNA-directed DNA polymerase from mobile element jockey-like [Nicrophorus vespilloides]|uniref:RNA-directed DNA polymerase from mobile element jockey-like n=1 Tax=Nicrophorus vespilloides TaxID=110193 RepID=A0ABM1MVG7_NICVS|nr:PREDICTED: RNA-directed DNA polymerase from mobile element jockey-like [Nicrophorus vespilloides]
MDPKVTVLSWNIKSIHSNQSDLNRICDTNDIDVVLLNETWLRPGVRCSVPNYKALHNRREDGKGGVSLLVKSSIASSISIPSFKHPTNAQFAQTKIDGLLIISAYIPPNVYMRRDAWDRLLSNAERPFILMGDLNAHHLHWGHATNNTNGRELMAAIHAHGLVMLNDMRPTRLKQGSPSILDLLLASPEAALNLTSSTWQDTFGSDHYPILCESSPPRQQVIRSLQPSSSTRINSKRIRWEKYSAELEQEFNNNPDMDLGTLTSVVVEAAKANSKSNPATRQLPSCPWRDDECSMAVAKRRRLLKVFHNTGRMTHLIAAKRAIAETKKLLKSKKRAHFRAFCETLSRDSPISYVWKKVRAFNHHNRKTTPLNRDANKE